MFGTVFFCGVLQGRRAEFKTKAGAVSQFSVATTGAAGAVTTAAAVAASLLASAITLAARTR